MVSRLESSCTFDLFGSSPQQNLDLGAKIKWEEVSRVEAMTTKQALSYCFALTTGWQRKKKNTLPDFWLLTIRWHGQ